LESTSPPNKREAPLPVAGWISRGYFSEGSSLLLKKPGGGLPFQWPPIPVPGAHAHGNGDSNEMGGLSGKWQGHSGGHNRRGGPGRSRRVGRRGPPPTARARVRGRAVVGPLRRPPPPARALDRGRAVKGPFRGPLPREPLEAPLRGPFGWARSAAPIFLVTDTANYQWAPQL